MRWVPTVEAELGLFGGGEGDHGRVEKASAEGSRRLVEETGIDNLAPAVGSIHGQSSRLDLPLLEEIAKVTYAYPVVSARPNI
jgi:fructose/tagatose bisphosphate aldolase